MNSKKPAPHSPLPRSLRRLLLTLSFVALCAAAALGQSAADASTPPGLAPGAPAGSYPLSGFDNVNFYNGHLNFRLPLVRVGGRGSAGYAMTLKLEQKWLVQHWYDQQTNTHYYWPDPNWWSGMEVGLGAGIVQARPGGAGSYACANEPSMGPRFTHTFTRLTATMPDGTEYELVDKETRGKPNYAEASGAPYYCTGVSFNRKKEFVTTDGSAATFVSDQEVYDPIYADGLNGPQPVSGYLYLRDGTRYRVTSGAVTEIRDRNGNKVTVSDSGATDSLGRQTTIQYGVTDPQGRDSGTGTLVSFAGFGGAQRSVFIRETNLSGALKGSGVQPASPHSLFGMGSTTAFNPSGVVSAVWLPDGRGYKFLYNTYGELARVEIPTGGAIEYDYAGGISDGPASGLIQVGYLDGGQNNYQVYRRVVERRVYKHKDDTTPESTMTVSRPESYGATYYNNVINTTGYVETTQRAGGVMGTILSGERHYYEGSAARSMDTSPGGFSPWEEGRETKTEALDTDGTSLTSVLRRVEHTWQQRAGVLWWSWWGTQFTGVGGEPSNDPRLVTTVTTVEPSGANLVTKQTAVSPADGSVGFDQFNNQTDSWEYDFGAGAAGGFARRTHTDYVTALGYVNSPSDATPGAHLRGLPSRQWVSSDASGSNKVTLTDYGYDQTALTARAGITGHDSAFTTGYTTRGNATGVTRYANAASETGGVTSTSAYDVAGNVVSSTDARGKTSTVSYGDSFCNGSTCGGTYTPNTYAFPTSATSPVPDTSGQYGSSSALVTSTVYDFWTGLTYSTTDANGKTTTLSYADAQGTPDPLDRLKKVTRPDGGKTDFYYGDAPGGLYVRTLSDIDSTRRTESKRFFDGLGRAYRTSRYENYLTSKPWVTADTEYDSLGRVKRSSMPYRAQEGDPLFSTDKWAETTYDALGRVRAVTTKPDDATVTTSYSGDRVLVKDQDGKERVSRADALGRLTDVWEIRPSDPDTVSIASFPGHPEAADGYLTSYLYDVTGNLRRVTQGAQQRFFMYDSLSRLTRAKNPEQTANASVTGTDPLTGNSQWSLSYGYDANGNLTSKTDARGTTAAYVYDALNRNVTITYSGGGTTTPAVTRHYDSAANGLGRLYRTEAAGVAQTTFTAYDEMGRPTGYEQKFRVNNAWGQAYGVQQLYNLAGGVTSQTYPSGHTVNYRYDITGRPADNATGPAFEGTLGDGAERAYASEVVYDETGGMNQERFGTDTPLYNKRLYNGRGQLAEIRLSTYAYTDPDQAKRTDWNRGAVVNHYSDAAGAWGATGGGPDNNGNLKRQEVYVPDGQGSTSLNLVQHYSYDDLNRLTSVEEKLGNATTQFVQAYRYDRWGNRTIKDDVTFNAPEPQFSVSTATNRLGVPAGQAGRMDYDASGNLVNDSYSAYGSPDGTPTRSYDAEGRMTSAALNQYESAVYAYDADGRRVKRNVGAPGEVWQVYGVGGELLAEYAPNASPASPQKEYGYRGGELLVVGTAALTAAAPSGLAVTAASNSPVSLSWTSTGAANYRVERGSRVGGAITYSLAGTSQAASFSDTGVTTGAAYLYRVCAADAAGNCVSPFGNAALATAYTFADDPLVTHSDHQQGINLSLPLTVIKAQHVTELREAVNAVRALAGLHAAAWAEANLSGSYVKASHVVELRDRLGEALTALGIPTPSYTDPSLGSAQSGTVVIKRAHFAELRAGATKGAGSGSAGSSSAGGVEWLVTDQLGTPRMVIDQTGSLSGVTRHDYFPFGEEIPGDPTARTYARGYVADHVRQKFTGYERDNETGLDYAQARYYSYSHGRFTATDPLFFQKKMLTDPQRFNLYQYVRNNPLNYVDPFGMELRISAQGNAAQAMADIRTLAGDLAQCLSFNAVRDDAGNILYYDVSFNVTAADVAGNEGAQLIFDLVSSENTFLTQRGGTVQRKYKDGENKGKIEDVDVNASGGGNITRNRPGPSGIFEPVDPNVDSIIYYPDHVVFVNVISEEDVQPIRTLIHEGAESFLLAQGIGYETAHGIYWSIERAGNNARIVEYQRDPRNAISREKAIAAQLNLTGGFSGWMRVSNHQDLRRRR